jgi:hypothetical protein
MAVKLSDGGHLAKLADGRIVRFDASGKQVESLKPGDTGYGYWLDLVCRFTKRDTEGPATQGR